jgi:hypothetical protein
LYVIGSVQQPTKLRGFFFGALIACHLALASTPSVGEELWRYPGANPEPIAFTVSNGIRVHCAKANCTARKHAHKGQKIPRMTSPEGRYVPGQGALCRRWGGAERILEDKNLGQEEFCEFNDGSLLALRDL